MHSAQVPSIDWNHARLFVEKCLRARRVFDASVLDDLVQDTLLRAHRAVEREAPRSIEALLSDLAAKTLVDHVRSRTRWARVIVPAGEDFDNLGGMTAEPRDDGEEFDDEILRALLAKLFAEHAPECRDLLRMRLAGDEWDAISARTGRSAAALRQAWKRGLDKVRRAVEAAARQARRSA